MVKFNVTLDNEEINKIASVAADKVLETVKYQRNNEERLESEIRILKQQMVERDSLIAYKEIYIERLRVALKKSYKDLADMEKKLKELEEK